MSTYADCLMVIKNILEEHCGVERSLVGPKARLQADLGLDSVGLLSLALELENEFEMYLGEDADNPPETVDDIARLILYRQSEMRDAS
ncbi:MAG: phosphopantetheine-binding protein [Myxococcota bacterium]|nr:phosphopantetheine-binding protein [Myxococcota bacterium]